MRSNTTLRHAVFDDPAPLSELFPAHPRRGVDRVLLSLVLILLVIGSVMVFSAGFAYAASRYGSGYYFIKRQVIWAAIGLLVMAVASRFTPFFYRKCAVPLYVVTVLLLCAVLALGSALNGAQRWIAIGPITVQPTEIAKLALPLLLARYFTVFSDKVLQYGDGRRPFFRRAPFVYGTLIPFSLIGLICLLVMLQKHLSGIIILGSIGLAVMFVAGTKPSYLTAFCSAAVGGVAALALFTDYTRRRIDIWLNPAAYPLDGGWQTLQGMMAIGSGGAFGLGLGNSRLKYNYVSEPANDFIFTITCEEIGFFGACLILILFAVLIYRGYSIGMRNPDPFSRVLAIGITTKVAIQFLLNIAVVTNSIPNTGISLPFFSYGGSSLVMLMLEMGILLSISRSSVMKP